MIAAQDFTHDGRTYVAGECFQCPPIHAAALKYQRKATFATAAQLRTRDLKAATPEPEAAPSRRRYRRRDMVAEP